MDQAKSLFEQSVPRVEDGPLLRGTGRFVDDIRPTGTLEAAFFRSSVAHARITALDITAAAAYPGVHGVFRMEDVRPHLSADKLSIALPSSSLLLDAIRPILASDEVRYVGEAIAVVVAETRYIAEDAAGLIEVEYDILPAVADCREGARPDAPKAHSRLPHNIVARFQMSYGACDEAFGPGVLCVRDSFLLHRGGSHSLECRGAVALHDPVQDHLTLWTSTQSPHAAQRFLCDLLRRDQDTVRVIAPDLGGGFGPKAVFYPEDVVVALAAVLLKRPVKWIEDRREHFFATAQERDQYWTMEMAFDPNGQILGIRGNLIHDQGAYLARGINVPYGSAITVPLPYNVPAYDLRVECVLTNKVPGAAVRGAGQPQAAFVMERLMDRMAQALGLDRAEVRRRNLVKADQMPCRKELKLRGGTNVILDSGDFPGAQEDALQRSGWADFPARREGARLQGRYIGVGLANYVESTGRGPFEPVKVRIGQDSRIYVSSSATAMGQGTKTMLAQIVAAHLGAEPSAIVVATGDTDAANAGFGGFNSRQAVVAGSSAHVAALRIREKVLIAAGSMLGVSSEQLEIKDEVVSPKHPSNQRITLGDIARALAGAPGYRLPDGLSPGLEHTATVIIDDMAFSSGSAVAEVEVDVETGAVTLQRFTIVHDCGKIINPMIVNGQVMGGVVHGIGNALFEWMGYNDQAQPITTNYGEYLLVTAPEVPPIEIGHRELISPLNPIGVKGVGESGVIPAAAAIISAIEDALAPFQVQLSSAPLAPHDIIEKITTAARARRKVELLGAMSG